MKPTYIDHVVLVAKDISVTADFYTHFLGKPDQQDNEQVCFRMGETKLFFVSPIKEYMRGDKDSYSLNHLAFGVRSLEELKQFEKVLNDAGITNKGVRIDKYGGKEYVSFDDPDGYRIEFYYRPLEK
jgi:glyoxylase I family protein